MSRLLKRGGIFFQGQLLLNDEMCYYKESVKISGILGEETYGSNTDAGWFFYGCDHLGVCSGKKWTFFKEEDFYVMSKIMVKITLPASIIVNFSQTKMEPSMFLLCLLGFGGGILYMALGWIMGGKDPDEKGISDPESFPAIVSEALPCHLPAAFFGPAGVVVTSLFDTGNAVIALGGSYSIGAMV